MKSRSVASWLGILLLTLVWSGMSPARAQVPPNTPDTAASDPKTLGWMQGFPPAPDKTIRFADGSSYKFPQWRWTFSHGRELEPKVNVWRDNGKIHVLPWAEKIPDAVPYTDANRVQRTWADMLALTYTDGILVLHKGKVISEKYFGAMPRCGRSWT